MMILPGSAFARTSPKLFWHETLVYLLPGAELNQMLPLVWPIEMETRCEAELLLFAGINDHLHSAGLLEPLRNGDTRVSGGPIGIKDEGSVHSVTRTLEHATRSSIWVCGVGFDCRRHRPMHVDGCSEPGVGASELEASEVGGGSGLGGRVLCLERLL